MARSASWKRSAKIWRYARVLLPLLAGAGLGLGQQTASGGGQAGQIVTQPAVQTPLSVTIVNNCKAGQSFTVSTVPAAPWIYFTQATSFELGSGGTTSYGFMLNPPGNIAPGEYQTNLTVTCTSCAASVPPCLTSAKTFPIDMVIPKPEENNGGGGGGGNPSGGTKPGGGTPNPPGNTGGNTPGGTTPGGTPGNTPGGTTPGGTGPTETITGTPGGTTPATPGGTTPTTPGGTTPGGTMPTTPGATTPTPVPSTPTPGSLPGLLGGLIAALGAATLLLGSGPVAAGQPSGVSEGTDPGTPVGATPQTPVGTTPGTTPQAPGTTPQTPVGTTPGTPATPAQTPGSWDATLNMPTQGSLSSATPPATSGPLSDGGVGQTPTPVTPQTPGSWDASLNMPLGDVAAPVGPQAGVGPVIATGFGWRPKGEYVNPQTGEIYAPQGGEDPPAGWIKVIDPLPPGRPGDALVEYAPGKEPRRWVNPKTGETVWTDSPFDGPDGYVPDRPMYTPPPVRPAAGGPKVGVPAGQPPSQPVVQPLDANPWYPKPWETPASPSSGTAGTPVAPLRDESGGGLIGKIDSGDNAPKTDTTTTPATPAQPTAPATQAAPATPIAPAQPAGETPKPNYGPGGILNQPLGEDPPPAKPNYGPGGILNQPLGEDPPPAKPNYGPGGILNQPLGEDPVPAKPVTAPTGDQKVGTGHTFSRGTTQEELDKANQPVAPGSLPATGTSTDGDGTDETGDRWRETNKGMVEKAKAEEPWDGVYDPKGESDWMKGVREDKAAAEARLKQAVKDRWGGNEDGVISGVEGAAYDQVHGDPIRHEQDLILRRVWQIEIYEAAYKKGRLSGLSNLAAHAYAQIQLDKWRDKSLEDFEQTFGTHFAQLGQAISGDPIGNLNKAIEKIGTLVDEAYANVEKSRAIARAIEKQRMQAQQAAELEKIASEEANVGAKSGARMPDPAGYAKTRAGIQAQIKDVNFLSQSKSNCVSCAVATDSALAGKPMGAFPDFDGMSIRKTIDFICDRFNTLAKPLGKGAAAQQQIIQALETSGEGSRGIVVVVIKNEGHAFNAVMRNGKVFFPDGQIGGFRGLSIFQNSDAVLFFPTTGG